MRPLVFVCALALCVAGADEARGEPDFERAQVACDQLSSGKTLCNYYLGIARLEYPKLKALLKQKELAKDDGTLSKDFKDELYNRKSAYRMALNGLSPYPAWYYLWRHPPPNY